MSKRWLVMFDRVGVDMLVPCDEIQSRDTLQWLGGKPFKSELSHHLSVAKMRARANPQRHPEIWAYDCEDDFSLDVMRELWVVHPQSMANLVRNKGTLLYKTPREKNFIV